VAVVVGKEESEALRQRNSLMVGHYEQTTQDALKEREECSRVHFHNKLIVFM
jgi:hypothetical protein